MAHPLKYKDHRLYRLWLGRQPRSRGSRWNPKSLPKPPVIPIPYRVMVPETVGNVICPGRAVNCECPVQGPMRVPGPIMAMDQAAGCAFRDVDAHRLRTSLADDGAVVSL